MLGIRTRGGRMEGADESTELQQHPNLKKYVTIDNNIKEFNFLLAKSLWLDVPSHVISFD